MLLSHDKNIAVAFDDNYIFPFLLLAFSISKNSTEIPHIYIANVNDTLSQENKKIIERFTSFLHLTVTILDARMPSFLSVDSRISIAAYGRLWLADHLTEDFVYIDTDSLVLPGWESVFNFHHVLEENIDLLLAAIPVLENKTPPWPIPEGDLTHYRFHSGVLVINHKNWSNHFGNRENLSWEKIALRYEELGLKSHDQSVLQFAAQGKFFHLPFEFCVFATKYINSAKIITSGNWRKPWTVLQSEYFPYINSLMMYQDYKEVFGVIKELDIFSKYRDELYSHLGQNSALQSNVRLIEKQSQIVLNSRVGIPFIVSTFVYRKMINARRFLKLLQFYKK